MRGEKKRGGENLPSITSIHGKMKREKETVRKRRGEGDPHLSSSAKDQIPLQLLDSSTALKEVVGLGGGRREVGSECRTEARIHPPATPTVVSGLQLNVYRSNSSSLSQQFGNVEKENEIMERRGKQPPPPPPTPPSRVQNGRVCLV